MASLAPEQVAETLKSLNTTNPSVVGDILDAALAMPPSIAVSLVPTVSRAAIDRALSIHFNDATELCVRLAEGQEHDGAMHLSKVLFAPVATEDRVIDYNRDVHGYKKGLEKIVPVLAQDRAGEFLPMLCGWLNSRVETKQHVDADSGDDHSYLWRPAIEEHSENSDYDFASVLTGFAREGFETAIRDGGLSLEEAFGIVDRYHFLVFKRLRMHLLAEFAEQNISLTQDVILNHEYFNDTYYKHEYAVLVGRRLNLLRPEQREEWFSWIDAGPDMSRFDESVRACQKREPTEADRKSRINYWQLEKLHLVRDHLSPEQRKFYEKVLAEHGDPQLADMNFSIRSGWGEDESPMTVEELAANTFEDSVDAVSSWRPEGSRFLGPNLEGLGRAFEQYVRANVAEFSTKARVLVGRPAIFVRGFISQMKEAIEAEVEIDLAAVLALCEWVVQQPVGERTTAHQEGERLVDENWQWTRDEISQFIGSTCKSRRGEVATYPVHEFRVAIWKIIEALFRDPAKSYILRDHPGEDPRVRDYLDLGINSPRGKAVEAAFDYARWVANHVKQSRVAADIDSKSFAAMDELRQMLDWQIARENRTFEALSVIGAHLSLIYTIDKEWLTETQDRLFNLQDIEKGPADAHGWAAWNAFLVWNRPHIEFYRIFRSQFAYAVEQAAKVELPDRMAEQPMYRLGEHLMILYGRGQIGLDDDDRLLRRFLEGGNPELRRHAIGFVGESLGGNEEVEQVILDRFQALWEWYWPNYGEKDAKDARDASLFGFWFSCGEFPDAWALQQLAHFVDTNPTPEPDHEIAERLQKVAHVDVWSSIRIVDRMVRGDQEGWRILSDLEAVKHVLKLALAKHGEPREMASKLIDYLGRRGYTEFGGLL
jgi:hypothetical protein